MKKQQTKFLIFKLCIKFIFIIFFLSSCLFGENGENTDADGLQELGPVTSSPGGTFVGSNGDEEALSSDNPLINPSTNRFNAFSPSSGIMEGFECDNPVDCFMHAQNHETSILESEKEIPPPICPYDKQGESVNREMKKVQITLSLCLTSAEALKISPSGILNFIHWSNGHGPKHYWVHGEGVGGDNWMTFYEYYNVGFCNGSALDRIISLQRSDKNPIYEWAMPAILPYDLGLNIDTTCTIAIKDVVAAPDNILAVSDWASNMSNVPTWVIYIGVVRKETPGDKSDQFQVGEVAFTIEYWEKLEEIIEE